MNGEFDRLRQLLLDREQDRLDALQADLLQARDHVPERVAEEIERGLAGAPSRLTAALAESTINGLELAVQRKPETVVNAVFPVIGPAIRRSIQESMRQLSADIDRAVNNALSPQALKWRIEAWRCGLPYAQVVLRHTARYAVEHLFLIQPGSGLLLGHLTARGLPELDADAVAGMFTAIQSFVRDSVQSAEGGIGTATVGDYQLVVSEGPQARLVAFVRGVPSSDFPVRLDRLNEALHARHVAALADGDGLGAAGAGLFDQGQLDALNAREEEAGAAPAPKSNAARYVLWGVLALVAALLLWWALSAWRWSQQVDAVHAHLSALPGVVLTQFDASDRGELHIEGLRDPLAPDPRAWLKQAHPKIEATWKLRGFFSMEPELVAARAAQALGLSPANADTVDAQGTLKLRGEAPFADWYRLRNAPPAMAIPGVARIDASALTYPQQARIEALIAQLESLTIPFASGAAAPDAGWEPTMQRIESAVRELQRLGGDTIAFRVRTAGLADYTGNVEQNAELRQQRAAWLAAQLADAVRAPSDVAVDQVAAAHGAHTDRRGVRVTAIPVPATAQGAPARSGAQ